MWTTTCSITYLPSSYESFLPIHQLWLSYMHRLLHLIELDGSPNVQLSDDQSIFMQPHQVSAVQATLTKADLCGAPIVVSRASNPALVGLEGLTVQETEGTFVIVNRKNQIKSELHVMSLALSPPPKE